MKTFLALVLVIAFSACASPAKRWSNVGHGQSSDEVIKVMGGNPHMQYTENGKDYLIWPMDNYSACAAIMENGKVVEKECRDNSAAREQDNQARAARAAAILRMQASQPQPYQAPAYNYQLPTNRQTNCTSRNVGGTVHTSCN